MSTREQELFPTFEVPDELEDLETDINYGITFRFDWARGDFVEIAGAIAELEGYAAWIEWIYKCLHTDRFVHLAYSDDYGIDRRAALEADTHAETELILEQTITEALELDPRTGRVYEFEFEWHGDKLGVSFIAEPAIGTPAQVEVTYEGLV